MKRKACLRILALICLLDVLSGCTFNPFSTHNELTGRPEGALLGGLIGGGIPALLNAPRAVIALAAVGGAGVGYYVTTLRFASSGIINAGGQVYTLGDSVSITVPTDKLFDSNTDEFLPCTEAILKSILNVLERYPCNNIIISGNSSGFDNHRYEQKLSESRARQVAAYLWAHGINSFMNHGIDLNQRRLTYVGYGNYFPVANDITNCGLRANSHIQITSYPTKAGLHLDKCHKNFTNVGDMEEPCHKRPERDYTHLIPGGYELAEKANMHRRDIFALDDTKKITSTPAEPCYEEPCNLKGELPAEVRTVSSSVQTSAGDRVVKQGGYKGECP